MKSSQSTGRPPFSIVFPTKMITISSVLLVLFSLCVILVPERVHGRNFNLTELENQIKGDTLLKNETEQLIRKILAKREELKSILVAPSNQDILHASAASQLQAAQQQQDTSSQQHIPILQQGRQLNLNPQQQQNFGQMMGSFMNTIGLTMRRMWDFFANALKMMRSMYTKVIG